MHTCKAHKLSIWIKQTNSGIQYTYIYVNTYKFSGEWHIMHALQIQLVDQVMHKVQLDYNLK